MPATGRKKGAPWSGLPPKQFQQEVERLWPDASEMQAPLGFGLPFRFGDGSDGNVTVAGTTSLTSHDIKQYLNLTIAAGGTLTSTETNAAVLIIYVRERLYVAGTIDMNGNGGNTADGDNADRYAGSGGGGGGGSGGAGGDGKDTIQAGGTGGLTGANNGAAGAALLTIQRTNVRMRTDARNLSINSFGASGGVGGIGGGAVAAGDGGGGIHIYASEVTVAATGIIRANGAAGAAAPTNSGGGGGGGGGFIYIVTRRMTITSGGAITVTGGAGGAASNQGAGGAGGAGTYILEQVPY